MGVLEEIMTRQDQILNELRVLRNVAESSKELLDVSQICERLKVHKNTFRSLIPELSNWGLTRIGRRWRISAADLEDYIESKSL